MSPLPQFNPTPSQKEPTEVTPLIGRKAANDDFFDHDTCVEALSEEDILTLFKKRKATEWMVHSGTNGNNQEVHKNELARILAEMRRYGISEDTYEKYLVDQGELVD
jgi:hypothetical protein